MNIGGTEFTLFIIIYLLTLGVPAILAILAVLLLFKMVKAQEAIATNLARIEARLAKGTSPAEAEGYFQGR